MSEENLITEDFSSETGLDQDGQSQVEDFDQNGLLLKVAVNGITVQDYVKRIQESDILVAVDGKIYRDGPARLRELFESKEVGESKWLLSFWRDGQIFDLLVTSPIQSQFGLATQQETDWALEQFEEHVYDEFENYDKEVYRDPYGVCDILHGKRSNGFPFPAWLKISFVSPVICPVNELWSNSFCKLDFVFDNLRGPIKVCLHVAK